MTTTEHTTRFAELLHTAVTEPGTVSKCYSAFHGYSLGNQLLASFECARRGLEFGPLNTYKGWQALGRNVRKGEKAITLCMPVTYKRRNDQTGEDEYVPRGFIYRPRWFVLSQTDGADYEPTPIGAWDTARALGNLNITSIPFDLADGNCQGYARDRSIAINPLAQHPERTLLHECAHILLNHTGENADSRELARNEKELEAESVALLVSDALGLSGQEESRGYIQHWYREREIPEKMAKRIIATAHKILAAGTEATRMEALDAR